MSDELLRKPQVQKRKPRALSIAYDSSLGRLFVLGEDGVVSVLNRTSRRDEFGELAYRWQKAEEIALE